MLKLWLSISRVLDVVATRSQRQISTKSTGKAFRIVTFNVRQEIKFVKSENDLAAWKVLYAERLWIERSSCCSRLLKFSVKKAEDLTLPPFFYRHHNPVGEANLALYCGRIWICRRNESAPEYFSISSVISPYSIEGLWIPIDPAMKVARTYPASWVSSQRPVKPIRCP